MSKYLFYYIDNTAAGLLRQFPKETSLFENGVDTARTLIEEYDSPAVYTPSQLLVKILFRSNLNYLIGSYKMLLNTIPSFAYMGMRVALESIVRGYYYLCNEDAACISYFYILNEMEDIGPDEVDFNILTQIKGIIKNNFVIQLCEKTLSEEPLTEDEKNDINNLDKTSRSFKKVIRKVYTNSRQNDMRHLFSLLSRYSHAGIRGRYRDLALQPDHFPSYKRDLDTLLLLFSANVLMYLETIDLTDIDVEYLYSIFTHLNAYPWLTPNKKKYESVFKFNTADNFKNRFKS